MMTNFRLLACRVLLCGLIGLPWHAPAQETTAPETALSPEAVKWVSEGKDLAAKGKLDGTLSAFTKAFLAAHGDDETSQVALACFVTAKSLFEKDNAASTADQLVDLAVTRLEALKDDRGPVVGLRLGATMSEKYGRQSAAIRYLQRLGAIYAARGDADNEEKALTEILTNAGGEAGSVPRDVYQRLLRLYTDSKNFGGLVIVHAAFAVLNEEAGDLDGAAGECRTAINTIEEQKIEDAQIPQLYNRCGLILREASKLEEARAYLEHAVKKEQDQSQLGIDESNLALVDLDLGQGERAVEEAKTSIETIRATKDRKGLAEALIAASKVYANAGQVDLALQAVDEARAIAREDGLDGLKQSALETLGAIRSLQGRSQSAAADLNQASEVAKNAEGKGFDSPYTWRMRGMALLQSGDVKGASVILEEAVKRAQAQNDLHELVESRRGLAAADCRTGRCAEAETLLLENLSSLRKQGDSHDVVETRTMLATLYVQLGRYYSALDEYSAVEKLLGPNSEQSTIQSRTTVKSAAAEIYLHLHNYSAGIAAANEAIQLATGAGLAEDAAGAERLAGRICLAQEDLDQARTHFLNAAKLDYHPLAFNEGLVEVYLRKRGFKDALEELSKVNEESLEQANDEIKSRFYTQRGIALMGLGQFQDALNDLNKAIGLVEYARLDVFGEHSVGYLDAGDYGSRTRAHQAMMEAFANFWLLGVKDESAKLGGTPVKLSIAALHYAEMTRGRTQFDGEMAARQKELFARLPKALQEKQNHFLAEGKRLAEQEEELRQKGEPPTAENRATEKRLQAEAAEFLHEMRQEAPEYDIEPGYAFIKLLQLHDNEVILEYAIGVDSVYLFVVRKQGIELTRLFDSPTDLAHEVGVFRDLVAAQRFPKGMAQRLYTQLVDPAEEYLKPNDKVIIVADGVLGLLPFEALMKPAEAETGTPTFFGANHQISYSQSISAMALARMIGRPVGSKPLFAVADPIFDKGDERYQERSPQNAPAGTAELQELPSASLAGGFRRLPDTRDEVEAVAKLVGAKAEPPDALIGEAADKASFLKSDLATYRYLHLATHAAGQGELGRVNQPFLVLGWPASGRFDDQIVTMSELMKLKLSAQLVVLAACETGKGDVLQGDGVASLASAFMYAGANNVVLSLWEVPSKASVFFMQKFYEYLREGKSESESLQLAKRAMRTEYPDPYFWANYVLYESGEPGRVSPKT